MKNASQLCNSQQTKLCGPKESGKKIAKQAVRERSSFERAHMVVHLKLLPHHRHISHIQGLLPPVWVNFRVHKAHISMPSRAPKIDFLVYLVFL